MALLKVLLLLLGLGVAVSSVSLQKRVVGGQNCKDDERRYHVVLSGSNKFEWSLCGGSLISDQWILTAAHCWKSGPGWTNTALIGVHPKVLDKDKDKAKAKAKTYKITHHEIYKDSKGQEHDIMLLKLPEKTSIEPIKLLDCPDILPVGTVVQIAGFGPEKTGSHLGIDNLPSDLQCAEIKVLKHGKTTFSGRKYQYDHWFCTESGMKGRSKGDSGGGWVFNNRLYGVYVDSSNSVNDCTKPSFFMDVCSYKKWIDDTINPPKTNGIKKQLKCLNCG